MLLFQYKKGEMTELLISQLPGEKSWEFKRDFISLVQSIFFMVARLVINKLLYPGPERTNLNKNFLPFPPPHTQIIDQNAKFHQNAKFL